MKLLDLEPFFIRYETRVEPWTRIVGDQATWRDRGCPTEEVVGPREYQLRVETLAEAQGIWFLCPKGSQHNDFHCVAVAFADRGVLPNQGTRNKKGEPVRWKVSGTGFHDLTLEPSVQEESDCGWHGHVRNGEIC